MGSDVEAAGGDRAAAPEDKRQVSTMGLLMIAFFWVGGGIYGNEPLVEAGPMGYVFVLLIGCAIFYALPMALISAELATALPYDGGLVAWVDETCGKTIGLHNMYWLWISYLFDSAAYPVLAAGYGARAFDLKVFTGNAEQGQAILAEIIIGIITLMKLAGTDYVVKMSGFFFVMSMLPSFIFCVYGSKDMAPEKWDNFDPELHGTYKPAVMFSWVTWLYCGFNSIGALAGEIKDPKATYPIVVSILIPMVMAIYIWPVAVAVSLDNDRSNYVSGHFGDLAKDLCGRWLDISFVVGAAFCFVGNYNAQIIVCERSIAVFGEEAAQDYLQRKRRNVVTRYLLQENGTGVAPVYIIINAVLAGLLVWLPYDDLIEFSMLQMCLNLALFMYAFLWYKWKMPDMDRPFCIPGGFIGAVIVVIPVLLISGLTAYFALIDSGKIFGLIYAKTFGLVICVGAGVIIHIIACGCSKYTKRMRPNIYEIANDNSAYETVHTAPMSFGAKGSRSEGVPLMGDVRAINN